MDIPPGAEIVSLVGDKYARHRTADGRDLHLTEFGLSFVRQIAPENWNQPHWFAENRVPLEGTSTKYRVPTMEGFGVSLDLVVRYSRVGYELLERLAPESPGVKTYTPN